MSQSLKDQLIALGFTRSHAQSRAYKPLRRHQSATLSYSQKDLEKAMHYFHDYIARHSIKTERTHGCDTLAVHDPSSKSISSHKTESKATINRLSISSDSRIVKIKPDAKLLLPKQSELSVYALCADEIDGIDPRFDDDGPEVVIGLDFGTSSVKAVLKRESDFVAIPFIAATGIDAYLLPTRLHQNPDGSFTLSSGARLYSSTLKLDLLADPLNRKAQINASIFLALILRQIRSWFYATYSKYDNQRIAWECAIGYPSTENDSQTGNLWKELLYRSWQLSIRSRNITLSVAEDIWKQSIESFENQISFEYFRSMPEVVAALAGFHRNQPIEDDFKGNYTLVDIGSGTVDVATFAYTKTLNQYTYNRTQFTTEVAPLGTTNCHHNRLNWLRNLFMKAFECASFTSFQKTQLSRFIQDIDREKKLSLLEPLSDSIAEYLSGIIIEPLINSADEAFSKKLTELIGRVRREAVCKNYLNRDDVAQMPVFLCGGGSRSFFYKNAFGKKHKNITWLAPRRFFEIHIIKDLSQELIVPLEQDDYDRLLVAYGLCAEASPRKCEPTLQGGSSVKEFQSYIDKDMV